MFSSLTKINGYNPIKALFLKEFWDHRRAILITPMVITGLFIVFVIGALVTGNEIFFNDMSLTEQMREGFSEARDEGWAPSSIITRMIVGSTVLLWIGALFTITFTSLSSLHDERKDGSILFWKSMPVSDTQEVLVKLATVAFVIPLMVVPFALIIEFFMVIVMTVIGLTNGLNLWEMLYSNINIPLLLVLNIVPQLITVLWILPIIAWFMLVSSFSRRPPFLIAFAVPAIVIAKAETFFNGSLLVNAIVTLFENWAQNLGEGTYFATTSFSEPSFWVGLIIAGGLTAGSIYFRKRHALA